MILYAIAAILVLAAVVFLVVVASTENTGVCPFCGSEKNLGYAHCPRCGRVS